MSYLKFVVLTSSRTGSTWLIDLLNSQEGVDAHGELFLHHPRSSPAIAGRADFRRFVEIHGASRLARVPRVLSYLNELYRTPRTTGFKLMYSQLREYPEILPYLVLRRVKIIHLMRRNHIDVIVSEELARRTGESHAIVGTDADIPMVHLDPTTLIERINQLREKSEHVRLLLRLLCCQDLEVSYESLLDGHHELIRILSFLDVSRPATDAQSSLAKRGGRNHRKAIVNYEEIKQLLSSTRFAGLLQ